ncbi:MAG: hypothetical protein ACXVZR_08980 [Terriglobales bacterium]
MPGDADPEHQAKRCIKILLDADLPAENAPQRNADIGDLWVDDSKAYKESRKPEPVSAKIVIVELVRDCVPKNLRKKEDDVLGNMALSAVALPGIGRMPNPIWYESGRQKIHMNSGVGRPIVNGKLASARHYHVHGNAMARPSAGMGVHVERCRDIQRDYEKPCAVRRRALGAHIRS